MMLAEIRCRVYPGQFSSEYAVIVESYSGPRIECRIERSTTLADQGDLGWSRNDPKRTTYADPARPVPIQL